MNGYVLYDEKTDRYCCNDGVWYHINIIAKSKTAKLRVFLSESQAWKFYNSGNCDLVDGHFVMLEAVSL